MTQAVEAGMLAVRDKILKDDTTFLNVLRNGVSLALPASMKNSTRFASDFKGLQARLAYVKHRVLGNLSVAQAEQQVSQDFAPPQDVSYKVSIEYYRNNPNDPPELWIVTARRP